MQTTVRQLKTGLTGTIEIPSDKSISHRAIMLSSLAFGKSTIKNFSKGQDPISTLNLFKAMGVDTRFTDENTLMINSTGKLISSKNELSCGNSGTTMRLVSGILAGQNFDSILTGDESLSKRPMKRIIEPLSLMGTKIESLEYHAPLKIYGQQLVGIDYVSPLASAQVKSSILLAGLFAKGKTSFTEPYKSRNHTELMLEYMGANITCNNTKTTIQQSQLEAKTIEIAGDISSAAYFIVAALIVPNSDIILKNVGLNPTRTGILDVCKQMGANIEILDKKTVSGEAVGDLRIKYSKLKACTIKGDIIPRLIDELPIIAILATQADGETIVKDAQDLRNKESDRIKSVVTELSKLGAIIKETSDGFIINGKTDLIGDCEVETFKDHRLIMSLFVAGLICQKPISIKDFEWINISFPEFEKLFNNLYS
ncbi:MAG: 3-phosphoshikimate 1-carboxyvinyltransferase [Clostridiaceae bacterium]|jgi:3-phosphoshikimate 1-carboxyvinyltransferase|nr:3-phosphoshikimate 1-carboxyvinyltransferase [Clostridiaceae bacterium]